MTIFVIVETKLFNLLLIILLIWIITINYQNCSYSGSVMYILYDHKFVKTCIPIA